MHRKNDNILKLLVALLALVGSNQLIIPTSGHTVQPLALPLT